MIHMSQQWTDQIGSEPEKVPFESEKVDPKPGNVAAR